MLEIVTVVVSVALTLLSVLLLACCAFWRRNTGFKDFDNESVASSVHPQQQPRPGVDRDPFPLAPPVDSTPMSPGSAPVDLLPGTPVQSNSSHPTTAPVLCRTDVTFINQIGTGWFGKVVVGTLSGSTPEHAKSGEDEPRKVLIKSLRDDCSSGDQARFLHESNLYSNIKHENVALLLGQCIDRMPFLIVYDYMLDGDLKWYLINHKTDHDVFSQESLHVRFASDMIAGLQAALQHGFIHSDIACRSFYVAEDFTVKLADYGLGPEQYQQDYVTTSSGPLPLRWTAPETLQCIGGRLEGLSVKGITREATVWSFGMTLWELVEFGRQPYSQLSDTEVLDLLLLGSPTTTVQTPDTPSSTMQHVDKLFELCQYCWQPAHLRPSVHTLQAVLRYLRSHIGAYSGHDLDAKWRQLLPRGLTPGGQRRAVSSSPRVREDAGVEVGEREVQVEGVDRGESSPTGLKRIHVDMTQAPELLSPTLGFG